MENQRKGFSRVAKVLMVLSLCIVVAVGSYTYAFFTVYPIAQKNAVEQTLTNIQKALSQGDFEFTWKDYGNGSYQLNLTSKSTGQLVIPFTVTPVAHLTAKQYRPWNKLNLFQQLDALMNLDKPEMWLSWADLDGNGILEEHQGILHDYTQSQFLISASYHAMTTVNGGKDFVEQQLFNPNASQKALYIGVSNSSATVAVTWQNITAEITDGGLARAAGTYVSTGVGAANVTKTFSVTATRSTKLYGLYYDSASSKWEIGRAHV